MKIRQPTGGATTTVAYLCTKAICVWKGHINYARRLEAAALSDGIDQSLEVAVLSNGMQSVSICLDFY